MPDQTPEEFYQQFKSLMPEGMDKGRFDDTPTLDDIARRRAAGQLTIDDLKKYEKEMEQPPATIETLPPPPVRNIQLQPYDGDPFQPNPLVTLHPVDFDPFSKA